MKNKDNAVDMDNTNNEGSDPKNGGSGPGKTYPVLKSFTPEDLKDIVKQDGAFKAIQSNVFNLLWTVWGRATRNWLDRTTVIITIVFSATKWLP